ncbi:GyrI-like domain-containing protein [Spirosoma flavum]|uniref:GyrI-like domain-containing protein n=1 Tax=Spirosoma flavum TaxID=2048557 RepID=A0ABW6AAF9_9BACT
MTTSQLTISSKAFKIKETETFTGLSFATQATLQTLSRHVPDVANNLYAEATRLGLDITGPIQWIYTGINGDETNEFQLAIVLPISQTGNQSDSFSYQSFPAFRCASYSHTGLWSDFGELYNALFFQLYRDCYQNDGCVREIYSVVDFENPENCVTEVQIGLV